MNARRRALFRGSDAMAGRPLREETASYAIRESRLGSASRERKKNSVVRTGRGKPIRTTLLSRNPRAAQGRGMATS